MKLFSQRDPRWSGHALGWGPALGTIGAYGCYETDFAMIALDSGFGVDPASQDDDFTNKHVFVRESTGTYDLLPDNALDLAYPGRFQTSAYSGYRADLIAAAVPSPDTYVALFISTASVPTHFVLAWSADGKYIADPWTGAVGTLAGYGGPAAIHKTILIKKLPDPGIAAAQAAQAAAVAKAASDAAAAVAAAQKAAADKAIADAAVAKAAADAQAVADAAAAEHAAAQAASDAADAALAAYLAEQAAKAKVASNPLPVPSQPVIVQDGGLQGLLILLLNFFLKVTGQR